KFERNEIFSEICDLLEASLPKGAEVLDVGGATGVFAEMLKLKRPDVSITISDISSTACDDSRARGFEAVQSSLSNLDLDKQFDLVLLLDVLYYEKDLNRAFTSLDKHLKRGGKILYRGPNKSFL